MPNNKQINARLALTPPAVAEVERLINQHQRAVAEGLRGCCPDVPAITSTVALQRSVCQQLNGSCLPHMVYAMGGRWYALWPVPHEEAHGPASFDVYPLIEVIATHEHTQQQPR